MTINFIRAIRYSEKLNYDENIQIKTNAFFSETTLVVDNQKIFFALITNAEPFFCNSSGFYDNSLDLIFLIDFERLDKIGI